MNEADLSRRFSFGEDLIRKAGDFALGYFRNLQSLDIKSKGLQDMVSQADLETEELIRDAIAEAFPDDAFFGEETGGIEPKAGQGVWVVDPIDGTAAFVKGIPIWCVSIGFMVDGQLEFGLVFDAVHDEMFAGRRGHGATLNGEAISPDESTSLTDGRITIGFSHRSQPEEVVPVIDLLLRAGGMYARNGSGALGLVYVACGRNTGYYEPHINSWDCYGAVVILREAGADVCEAEAGDGLTEGCEIIASAPGITREFDELLEKARAMR
jgi:myo-inositol-1(or 4)-monophosphatase